MNWWDQYEYNPQKNSDSLQDFVNYQNRVYAYFDLECSTDKLLTDYLCDDIGDHIQWLIMRIESIIAHNFYLKNSANNCAMSIKGYLDSKDL